MPSVTKRKAWENSDFFEIVGDNISKPVFVTLFIDVFGEFNGVKVHTDFSVADMNGIFRRVKFVLYKNTTMV